MTRPLARLGIVELEALFETSKHDLPALIRLIGELAYRNVPRAIALLDKAQRVLKFVESNRNESLSGTFTPTDSRDPLDTPTPSQNGFEFDVPIFAPTELPKRPPAQVTVAAVAKPVPVVLPVLMTVTDELSEPAPFEMSVEKAYTVLKATSASPWDAIEFSRRQLVARAQLDRVAKLESANRQALQNEAREANIAYKVLLQSRP